jgi:hypothetical protein
MNTHYKAYTKPDSNGDSLRIDLSHDQGRYIISLNAGKGDLNCWTTVIFQDFMKNYVIAKGRKNKKKLEGAKCVLLDMLDDINALTLTYRDERTNYEAIFSPMIARHFGDRNGDLFAA